MHIYTHVYTHVYAHVYAHVSTHMSMNMSVHMSIHRPMHKPAETSMHSPTHVHTQWLTAHGSHPYVLSHACLHTCLHTHMSTPTSMFYTAMPEWATEALSSAAAGRLLHSSALMWSDTKAVETSENLLIVGAGPDPESPHRPDRLYIGSISALHGDRMAMGGDGVWTVAGYSLETPVAKINFLPNRCAATCLSRMSVRMSVHMCIY